MSAEDVIKRYFDPEFYVRQHGIRVEDPLAHFLSSAEAEGLRPSLQFDPVYYAKKYRDLKDGATSAFLHFVQHGARERRYPNLFRELLAGGSVSVVRTKSLFAHLIGDKPSDEELETAFETYALDRDADGYLQSLPRFSSHYYRDLYPDVTRSGSDPLLHFLSHGHREGRHSSGDIVDSLLPGGVPFDPEKPTIIVVVHELSRTGAPIVGLDLMRSYSAKFNVVGISGRGGDLEDEFKNLSVEYSMDARNPTNCRVLVAEISRKFDIYFAVVNSIEATDCLPALNIEMILVVTLIHEYPQYTLPREKLARAIFFSDWIVFSSRHVQAKWFDYIDSTYEFRFTHSSVQHQPVSNSIISQLDEIAALQKRENFRDFALDRYQVDLRDKIVIMGGGTVQLRKGVDLFLQTHLSLKWMVENGHVKVPKEFLFLWIGGGFSDKDLNFGLWLNEQISHVRGAEFVIMEPNEHFHHFMAASDLFFCSSRLDPFPNVIIDAVCLGKDLMVFDDATGCGDVLNQLKYSYLKPEYANATDAADLLARHFSSIVAKKRSRSQLVSQVRKAFVSNDLIEEIDLRLREIREWVPKDARDLMLVNALDLNFLRLPFGSQFGERQGDVEVKKRFWGRAVRTGNQYFNPAAGVNVRRTGMDTANGAGQVDCQTHRTRDLATGLEATSGYKVPSLLIHYHAYYVDKLGEFFEKYRPGVRRGKVLVTTDTEEKRQTAARYIAENKINGRALRLRNRGRDYGPMFELLEKGRFDQSDVVLHVHAKRSPDIGAAHAAQWESYLYDMLLGDDRTQVILDMFGSDPNLGLVYPDDRHSLGWGLNAEYAQRLVLGDELSIGNAPEQFPIGSMFFIRTSVLRRCWDDLPLAIEDLPEEPVPYDGTVLHALERLWPTLVQRQGATFSTVYAQAFSR